MLNSREHLPDAFANRSMKLGVETCSRSATRKISNYSGSVARVGMKRILFRLIPG
jgi:hypothetical protein